MEKRVSPGIPAAYEATFPAGLKLAPPSTAAMTSKTSMRIAKKAVRSRILPQSTLPPAADSSPNAAETTVVAAPSADVQKTQPKVKMASPIAELMASRNPTVAAMHANVKCIWMLWIWFLGFLFLFWGFDLDFY